VQLLVNGMLACVRSRTRIEVLWSKSRGGRLYSYQADLLDRRPICCHIIIRDSGVAEIVVRELQRPNLGSEDAYRLVNFGHRRRRHTCVLDTIV
jgi:hypothetical protein